MRDVLIEDFADDVHRPCVEGEAGELLEEVAGEGAGEVEVEGVVPERMKEGGINLY